KITIVDTTLPVISTGPTGKDLGCNPSRPPTCDSVKAQVVARDTCGSVTLNCQVADSDSGCTHTRTFTITAQDACGNTSRPCTVTYTWTVDTTPPTTTCPTAGDLGCNPAAPPTDASVLAQVAAADYCNRSPARRRSRTAASRTPASSRPRRKTLAETRRRRARLPTRGRGTQPRRQSHRNRPAATWVAIRIRLHCRLTPASARR